MAGQGCGAGGWAGSRGKHRDRRRGIAQAQRQQANQEAGAEAGGMEEQVGPGAPGAVGPHPTLYPLTQGPFPSGLDSAPLSKKLVLGLEFACTLLVHGAQFLPPSPAPSLQRRRLH